MSTIVNILFAVAMMPIILNFISHYFKYKEFGVVDNNNPRQQAASLSGPGSRSIAAQQNAWEALALFSAAILGAYLMGASAEQMLMPAYIFLAMRIAHALCYLADWAILRSIVWIIGLISCIWIIQLGS